MIICTKTRTFIRGSILTITLALVNITANVFQFLTRYVGEGAAAKVILICAKAALEEDAQYQDAIVQTLVEARNN